MYVMLYVCMSNILILHSTHKLIRDEEDEEVNSISDISADEPSDEDTVSPSS